MASQIPLPTRPPEECRVLVVDDEPIIVDLLTNVLERDGYQIITATNGYEALERVQDSAPDVIVLDVLIPGVDGIAVCRQLKQSQATRFLPVILVTGSREKHRRVEGLAASANEFLNKPIDILELRVRVRTLLRNKQLSDELEAQRAELEVRVAQRTEELREANRRLEELNQVKGNVIAIVSHEVRTPAVHVKMALEALREADAGSDEARRLWQKVDQAFNRLEYKLDEIQAFSDPTDLKLRLVSVSDLVHSAAERARRLHPELPGSLVRLHVGHRLPPVMVDATKLARALTHLIENGLKFGLRRPVDVTADAIDGGELVQVSVRDQGSGIAPEVVARLYEPLQQGEESSLTRRHDGVGLGLALTRMVLQAHGVELQVETAVGRGSTFWFDLPGVELQ